MINRFMYIEDGSVDVDNLQEELAEDTKIIIYRQGSTPPVISELTMPARDILESISQERLKENKEFRAFLDEIAKIAYKLKNTPKAIKKVIDKYYDKYGD